MDTEQQIAKSHIIFIANLYATVLKEEVQGIFEKFGKIVSIDLIKKKNDNVYAFIEFDDMRDAVDALQSLNMTQLKNKKLRIEYKNGGSKQKPDASNLNNKIDDYCFKQHDHYRDDSIEEQEDRRLEPNQKDSNELITQLYRKVQMLSKEMEEIKLRMSELQRHK